jgi:hypothetical protein
VERYAVVDYLSVDRLEKDELDKANVDALIGLMIGYSGAGNCSSVDQMQRGDVNFRRNGGFEFAWLSANLG